MTCRGPGRWVPAFACAAAPLPVTSDTAPALHQHVDMYGCLEGITTGHDEPAQPPVPGLMIIHLLSASTGHPLPGS
ncbi:MAG: hypothetical protein ACRDNF_06810 [Streptosporangiaceae bacterium]